MDGDRALLDPATEAVVRAVAPVLVRLREDVQARLDAFETALADRLAERSVQADELLDETRRRAEDAIRQCADAVRALANLVAQETRAMPDRMLHQIALLPRPRDGRDGHLTIAHAYVAGRVYEAGEIARHRGGTWQAIDRTVEAPGPDAATWRVIADGVVDIDMVLDDADPRAFTLGVDQSDGLRRELTARFPIPLHRRAYRGDGVYEMGDEVAVDGNTWRCVVPSASSSPPSDEWALVAMRGGRGKQGPQGPQGEHGERGPTGRDGAPGTAGETGPRGVSIAGVVRVAPGVVQLQYDDETVSPPLDLSAIRYVGVYAPGETYQLGDIVRLGFNLFVARRTTSMVPNANSDDWALFLPGVEPSSGGARRLDALHYRGAWEVAANNPDLLASTPDNGDFYTCVTVDPDLGEIADAAIPGIGGVELFNGDMIVWTETAAAWQRIRGHGITRPEADLRYVFKAGDAMTGFLTLNDDPVDDLHAATKRYLDGNFVLKAGDTLTGALFWSRPIGVGGVTVRNDQVLVDDGIMRSVMGAGLVLSPWFEATGDPGGYGFGVLGADGGLYKRFGGGLILRQSSGDQRPIIELNDGSNRWEIHDERNAGFRKDDTAAGTFGIMHWYEHDIGTGQDTDLVQLYAARRTDTNEPSIVMRLPGQGGEFLFRSRIGIDGEPRLFLYQDPEDDLDAATKRYVDTADGNFVLKAGDVMTGGLAIRDPAGGLLIIDGTPAANATVRLTAGALATFDMNTGGDNIIAMRLPTGEEFDLVTDGVSNTFSLRAGGGPTSTIFEVDHNQRIAMFTVPPRTTVDPANDDDLARKRYVDELIGRGPDLYVSKAGDTMTDNLTVRFQDTGPSSSVSVGTIAGSIAAVQLDGIDGEVLQFAREGSGKWTFGVTPMAGQAEDLNIIRHAADGTVADIPLRISLGTGLIFAGNHIRTEAGDPIDDNDLTRKGYIDTLASSLIRYQGLWQVAANNPDLTTFPAAGGDYFIAETADPQVAEIAPPTIPGIGGQTIFNHDWILWSPLLGEWQHLTGSGGGLTRPEADARYIMKIGDNMQGFLTLFADPVQDLHAASKRYIDRRLVRDWAQDLIIAAGDVVRWDNMLFRARLAIPAAPVIPDYSTLDLYGQNDGDYWQGEPSLTNYATGNWMHLLTVPAYGTFRFHMDIFGVGCDCSFLIEISTTFNAASMTVSMARNPAGIMFNQFRLSDTASNGPKRLEGRIGTAGATPSFKLHCHGLHRDVNTPNGVIIPKPPEALANGLSMGGTQRAVLTSLEVAGATAATSNIVMTNGGFVRFGHATPTDINDGKIGTRLFNRGLNIIGAVTEAGNAERYIHMWGIVENENRSFVTIADGQGYETNAGGRFYKATGSGLMIRCHSGNTQPQIENNDGSNRRAIIDTVNGDARYLRIADGGKVIDIDSVQGNDSYNQWTRFLEWDFRTRPFTASLRLLTTSGSGTDTFAIDAGITPDTRAAGNPSGLILQIKSYSNSRPSWGNLRYGVDGNRHYLAVGPQGSWSVSRISVRARLFCHSNQTAVQSGATGQDQISVPANDSTTPGQFYTDFPASSSMWIVGVNRNVRW